jgi:indole-3-glycerol phosphate synthase/phosphoribosylanthranilate isomerase
MAETFLERIVAATREELAARQAEVLLEEMRARAAAAPPPRDFASALDLSPQPSPLHGEREPDIPFPAPGQGWGCPRLIAEIKRASPSKGIIAEEFDPVARARAYEASGAAAISVLTEPCYFKGSLDHLRAVRAAVRLPVLRKDFLLDAYQVYEARAAGADAVLLLCSLLDDAQLRDLLGLAHMLGMEALVEAHDAEEARRAVAVGARVIGVNARDLRSFAVNPDVIRELRPLVPADRIFVAESGIADALGAARASAWGADAILVGEALMRAADPEATARALATAGGRPLGAFFAARSRPFVKICGLTTVEHARLVMQLGADAFGLVFAPMAPPHRRVTVAQAREIVAARNLSPSLSLMRGEEPDFPFPRSEEGARGAAPLAVGVFVNERAEVMIEIAREVRLDALQLSGDEPPVVCAELHQRTHLSILKALRPRTPDDLAQLDEYALAGAIPLLDTPRDGVFGGTGEAGDWALAREAGRRWPVILAGGLTPENVAVALAATGARGVDVSSGVESARAKDPTKIARFIRAARGRDRK